jgi:hypothetical protein
MAKSDEGPLRFSGLFVFWDASGQTGVPAQPRVERTASRGP